MHGFATPTQLPAPNAADSGQRQPATDPAADVAVRTHQLVARLAAQRQHLTSQTIIEASRRSLIDRPMVRASRAGRRQLASLTAMYFRYFCPPLDWQLQGVEVPVAGGRIDLVWSLPDGRITYDELKTSERILATEPERRQAARYLAAGLEHGDRFVGLRLLCLAVPRQSRLITADRNERLETTELWFEQRP